MIVIEWVRVKKKSEEALLLISCYAILCPASGSTSTSTAIASTLQTGKRNVDRSTTPG